MITCDLSIYRSIVAVVDLVGSHVHFPLDPLPRVTLIAEGICALKLHLNWRCLTCNFLVFVDDILIQNPTLDLHLAETDLVLGQLTAAGAKISLSKCQFCKTKVDYVGLSFGAEGVTPQVSRIQGITNIKAPTNVSELRSFL